MRGVSRVQVERNTFSWTEVWRIFWKEYRLATVRPRDTIEPIEHDRHVVFAWSIRDETARWVRTLVAVDHYQLCGIMAVATSSRLRSIIRFRVSGCSLFPVFSYYLVLSLSHPLGSRDKDPHFRYTSNAKRGIWLLSLLLALNAILLRDKNKSQRVTFNVENVAREYGLELNEFWLPNVAFRCQIPESNCLGHLDRFDLPGTSEFCRSAKRFRGRWSLCICLSRVFPVDSPPSSLSKFSLWGQDERVCDMRSNRLVERRNPPP